MRIHKYDIDTVIGPNDILLGTDKDNPGNVTKNYQAAGVLGFLGTNYNLQSADLVYDFTIESESTLQDGEFTTNNRTDNPVNSSGVTTLYVSKTSKFARDAESLFNVLGTSGYSLMILDFADYNNFAVGAITAVSDFSSTVLQITITNDPNNGIFTDGNTFGLKFLLPAATGGAVTSVFGRTGAVTAFSSDYSAFYANTGFGNTNNYLSTNNFQSVITSTQGMVFSGNGHTIGAGTISIGYGGDDAVSFSKTNASQFAFLNYAAITQSRTFTLPNLDGNIPVIEDISESPIVTTTNNTLFTTAPTNITVDGTKADNLVTFTANFTEDTINVSASTEYIYICSFTIPNVGPDANVAASVMIDDILLNSAETSTLLNARVINNSGNAVVTLYIKMSFSGTGVKNLNVAVSGAYKAA